MTLSVNWKLLNSRKLFLNYQRPAYKERDMETVKLIGKEMARRLRMKGLTKTRGFGWMATEKIARGLEEGAIKEWANDKGIKDGSLMAVVSYAPIFNKAGEPTKKVKSDFTKFEGWLKS